MAFYELTMGLGFALGPFIGSGLYLLGKFTLVMAFYCGMGGGFLFIVLVFSPKREFDRSGADDMDPLLLFEFRLEYINKEKKRRLEENLTINSEEIVASVSHMTPKDLVANLQVNSYCYLLQTKRVFFAAFSCFLLVLLFAYYEPLVANHFTEDYGVSEAAVGLIVSIPFITYSISSFLSSKLLKYMHCRLSIFLGFLLCGLSFITLFGPS